MEELSGSLSSGDGGDKGTSVWRRYVVSYVPGVAGVYLWQGVTRIYEALIANAVGEGDSKRAFRNVPMLMIALQECVGLCVQCLCLRFYLERVVSLSLRPLHSTLVCLRGH